MIYLTAIACSFAFVFLKAFQQRNVAFDNYIWVLPTSYCMAFAEVYVIALIAQQGAGLLLNRYGRWYRRFIGNAFTQEVC